MKRQRGKASLYLVIITALFFGLAAQAEPERKEEQQRAADETRKNIEQGLKPNMVQHIMKSQEHLRKAEEARQQKQEGKAQQEEQMAMMEQMKAQQLGQQIQANQDEAQKNDAGAAKLRENPDPKGQNLKAGETPIISLRFENPRATAASATAPSVAPVEAGTPIPVQELADLGSITPSAPEESSWAPEDDGKRFEQNQLNLGFDESTKGGGKTPEVTTTQTAATKSSGGQSGPAMIVGGGSSGGASGSSGGGAGGGDFWGAVGDMVDASNTDLESSQSRLHMKSLRGGTLSSEERETAKKLGDLPGADLTDEAFWKKVGREPKQCQAKAKSARSRNTCLRTARKEFEQRWKDSHKRKPASAPEGQTTASVP